MRSSETLNNVRKNSLLKAIESYSRYFASGNGHTARAKRLDLKHFTDFLCNYRGLAGPEKLHMDDWDFSATQRFVDESLGKGQAPATVARRLATLKHMGRVLSERMPGFMNPAREVKAPKLRAAFPKALDSQEVASVEKVADSRRDNKDSFIRRRNLILLEFLLGTGLRAEEVRLLKLSQLDEKLEWIKNVRTKGRRFRNVYLISSLRKRLREYLEWRGAHLKKHYPRLTRSQDTNLPLFISTYRAKAEQPDSFLMGAKTIWRAINECSSGTQLHPHLLRHSFATELLNSSNDIRLVAQALGHSDVRITMRYTERKDQEVAVAMEKATRKR